MKKILLLFLYIVLILYYSTKLVYANVSIDCENLIVGIGPNITIQATGNTDSLIWSSTNPEVATISKGLITGKSEGTTYISVRNSSNESDICKVMVKNNYTPVSSISLDKTSDTIVINETKKINATVKPDNASNKTIKYTSLDPSVVTVTSDGYITGKKVGTTSISLNIENRIELYKVTVTNVPSNISLKSISIESTKELSENGTGKLTVTYNPSNATNKKVTWKSSDTNIVTVDSNGNLKAIGSGTATITVTSSDGNHIATSKITVNAIDKSLKGISLNKSTITLEIGNEEKLEVSYNPSNAENKKVSWFSSNESVIKVTDGKITALKPGTAEIKAISDEGNYEAICKITVLSPPIDSIAFEAESIEVYVGSSTTLNTISVPENTAINNPIWTSSNEEVATIKDGIVNALKIGETTITISDQEAKVTASIIIKVIEKPEEALIINIDGYNLNFDPNVKNYNLLIGNETSLKISTNKDDEITIGGNRDLKNGSIITITTKGKNKTTYVINIQKKGSYTLYFIAAISLLLFINIIRLLIKNKKNK